MEIKMTGKILKCERGWFHIADETKESLKSKGYGLWFETTTDDGKHFSIMHNYESQTAVACRD